MERIKIGVFDSGIGGLTVLNILEKEVEGCTFLYYGDNSNAPYGLLDYNSLISNSERIVETLYFNGCKYIVVACNTVTTKCLTYLRREYPDITFFGVEPAIAPACKFADKVLVLCTPNTASSERMNNLVSQYLGKKQIEVVGLDGFASIIEKNLVNKQAFSYLKENLNTFVPELSKLSKMGFQAVVLGCTHYVFLQREIEDIFSVPVIDGNHGVAKRLKNVVFGDNRAKLCSNSIFLGSNSTKNKNIYSDYLVFNSSDK